MAFIVVHKRTIKSEVVGIVGSRHRSLVNAKSKIYNNTSFILEEDIRPFNQPGMIRNYEKAKSVAIKDTTK